MSKSHRLRVNRYSQCNSTYSVTFCTINRQPYLSEFRLARAVINAMKFQDTRHNTTTLAFVIMPDHVHWLFTLNQSKLNKVLHSVKSFTAHQFGQTLWQDGYFEHNVRKEEDLIKLSRYIVANPLRANLVNSIGDYPFWDAVWINGYL